LNIRAQHITIKVIAIICLLSTLLYTGDSNSASHTIRIIVPEVALLDIESEYNKNIPLLFTAPSESGEPITSSSNSDLWLNVTSIVSSGDSREITVKIDNTIPGLDLKVMPKDYQGNGFGYWGTPNSELSLTTFEQVLISGIRSGVTANSFNNGYNLEYEAALDNSSIKDLVSTDGKDITVTYTISN
jgi:hypothetical protein